MEHIDFVACLGSINAWNLLLDIVVPYGESFDTLRLVEKEYKRNEKLWLFVGFYGQ